MQKRPIIWSEWSECVCEREREKERERKKKRERKRERGMETERAERYAEFELRADMLY